MYFYLILVCSCASFLSSPVAFWDKVRYKQIATGKDFLERLKNIGTQEV